MRFFILFFAIASHVSSYSQQLSVMPVFDEVARASQLNGKTDSAVSFCIRPIYNLPVLDSLVNFPLLNKTSNNNVLFRSGRLALLPVIFQQQYNSHHPYGWNDGSMIPAKGYENQLSFGISLKKGIVSLQVRPELVYTYNSYFSTFPSGQRDNNWNDYYYYVVNRIDAPDRFGNDKYLKVFPGQSNFRINYHKLSLGVSTENLWWGPGKRNSLLMSNNAPGFPHVSFNSSQPVVSRIGSFEWQFVGGKLKGSGIIPTDTIGGRPLYQPKENGDRYLNGVVITWQPRWTKGLFIGFSRVFYQYISDLDASIPGYLPVIDKFFKNKLSSEDAKKRDQLLSFFFRLILPKEKAELYGEFGRNDHSYNLRDFSLEPEHSRAYILGFSKTFEGRKRDVELYSEITNLQMSSTLVFRAQESWYTHYQVRHGYTNYGQVIGAGIGPGGSDQTIGLKWIKGFDRLGCSIERIAHNNDYYYYSIASFSGWERHWIDYSLNINKSWRKKTLIFDAQLSFVKSLNYYWYYPNVFHCNARVGVCYVFSH